MINVEDQNELFKLIASYLKKDISCIAIGGTAMMFSGYKNTTKDIDLVFQNNKDRDNFIDAIKELGYKEISLIKIYDKKRLKSKTKPKIFTRGEERFDLFTKDVFGFKLELNNNFIEKDDFIDKNELNIYILPKEYLILLKSITNREKDYEDIETIIKIEKEINWELIINEAINQKNINSWILIDLEETMQKLKKITFIKKKYFNLIYVAQTK